MGLLDIPLEVTGGWALAARACLDLAGVRPGELDHIAVSRDPRVHLAYKALHVAEHLAEA